MDCCLPSEAVTLDPLGLVSACPGMWVWHRSEPRHHMSNPLASGEAQVLRPLLPARSLSFLSGSENRRSRLWALWVRPARLQYPEGCSPGGPRALQPPCGLVLVAAPVALPSLCRQSLSEWGFWGLVAPAP